MRQLFQIDIGYACGGIAVEDGIVSVTPPIFKWMKGKSIQTVSEWVIGLKKGKIVEVKCGRNN